MMNQMKHAGASMNAIALGFNSGITADLLREI
jgi:hypothetical protein